MNMNHSLFLSISWFALINTPVLSQSFLAPGNQWVFEDNIYVTGFPIPLVSQTIETITVGSDTIINQNIYSELTATVNEPCGVFSTTEFLREEGNRIYRLSHNHDMEFLMIDFDETDSYQLLYEPWFSEIDTATAIIDSFGIEILYDGTEVDVQYMHILNNQSFEDEAIYKVYRNIGFVQYGLLFPYLGVGLCDVYESIGLRCQISGTDTLHFTEYDCFESSIINSVRNAEMNSIQLFPNPVSTEINIPSGMTLLDMMNMNGQRIKPDQHGNNINVNYLPSGQYYIRLFSYDKSELLLGRIIKI
jgi:hypothetical protein